MMPTQTIQSIYYIVHYISLHMCIYIIWGTRQQVRRGAGHAIAASVLPLGQRHQGCKCRRPLYWQLLVTTRNHVAASLASQNFSERLSNRWSQTLCAELLHRLLLAPWVAASRWITKLLLPKLTSEKHKSTVNTCPTTVLHPRPFALQHCFAKASDAE